MTGSDTYTVELVLAVPCATCGESRSVQASGDCPVCGNQLPADAVAAVREAVRNRRQAFKGRLTRLEQRMHSVADGSVEFATRGIPLPLEEHLNKVLLPFMKALGARHETVRLLLGETTWDSSESGCVAAFNELIRALDTALSSIIDLRETMPPLEWRAVHRELTRAAVEQIRGQINIALTIVASDADAALRLQEEGRRSFANGTQHAERIAALIKLIDKSPSDGPFQADGSIDIAMLTWASVGQEATSILNGAEQVRSAFNDIPGMADLPDQYAVLLLPLLASAAWVVDYGLLIGRTRQLRAVLDGADTSGAWLIEAELLVNRVLRGVERITNETERLGREWRYGLPRAHVMNSLAEVYRQLIEGALRDLGGIILIAARAHRGDDNGTYEQAVIDGIKAGEVVDGLVRIGAPCGGAVDMLYRNASAHADIEVTSSGIIATERVIDSGRVISSTTTALSDAEFAEEMIALQEILLALQLTILPWMWSHTNARVSTAMASIHPSASQTSRTLALLGGMVGLRDVAVSIADDHITVTANRLQDDSDRREIGILSLVPAAFGAQVEANSVTLNIVDLRPVTFARIEFAPLESDEAPHSLPMLGLTTAKWLIQSSASWTNRDEATYVTFPLTMLHFTCMRLAGSTPHKTENIDQSVESLRLVRSRLGEVLPPKDWSPLTQRAVEQIDILTTSLTGLAQARRDRRQAGKSERLAREAAATVDTMYKIQEEAKALRDANNLKQ